ncbi:MAG: arginase family protein, partial [Nanobdellota archaeon]
LIMLDAHPDCESDFMPPSHEDLIRGLVNNKDLKPENIIILGIRNWHKDELDFLEKNGIRYFTMKEISFEGLREVSEAVMSIARRWSSTYVSIDIDIVDPAFAPGTGYPESGGLTSRELLFLLQRFRELHNLTMVDLVEINPELDKGLTAKLGAKIVKECSLHLSGQNG